MPTGLARITKDLAIHVASLPQFRVATMGRGVEVTSKLPFTQYPFPEEHQWGENHLQRNWEDFAGPDIGVIMTIWDPSRLDWYARPRMGGDTEKFLGSGRFQKWAYLPVDSFGVGGRLTGRVADTLQGFDRRLAYTAFGAQVVEATMGQPCDWIPHGYNPAIFQPRDRVASRMTFGIKDEETLVGCVMTNQSRKDWATAFGAIAYLKNQTPLLKFWAHTDVYERYWNLLALIEDFHLEETAVITYSGQFTNEQLSYAYSACDVTMLPSLGEGFGYPIIESLACGVPCVHGNYGGGVEWIPDKSWIVPCETTRLDGMWNNVRPVWNPNAWANTLSAVLEESRDGMLKDVCTNAVEHLQWPKLWESAWKKWFLSGLA